MASSLGELGKQNAYAAVAASATDSVLVAAGSGKIVVHAVVVNQGDTTPSAVTFNTKGSGAGTAIFPALKAAANGSIVLPANDAGWFATIAGEGLTVTTGAGSTTSIVVTYGRSS